MKRITKMRRASERPQAAQKLGFRQSVVWRGQRRWRLKEGGFGRASSVPPWQTYQGRAVPLVAWQQVVKLWSPEAGKMETPSMQGQSTQDYHWHKRLLSLRLKGNSWKEPQRYRALPAPPCIKQGMTKRSELKKNSGLFANTKWKGVARTQKSGPTCYPPNDKR